MRVALRSLDHVAVWTDEREELARFLLDRAGVHEIERTDSFTLLGADARRGKLTLFDAEGPREPDALERVVLRVRDLDAAVQRAGGALLDAPGGLKLGLVQPAQDAVDYDLDHVVLRVPDPHHSAQAFAEMGFERRDGVVAVGNRAVRLERGDRRTGPRPLLNHLAVLVDSASEVQDEAERNGWEIDDIKDAANTFAVFLRGPDGIRIEYVEHKPGFALK